MYEILKLLVYVQYITFCARFYMSLSLCDSFILQDASVEHDPYFEYVFYIIHCLCYTLPHTL